METDADCCDSDRGSLLHWGADPWTDKRLNARDTYHSRRNWLSDPHAQLHYLLLCGRQVSSIGERRSLCVHLGSWWLQHACCRGQFHRSM